MIISSRLATTAALLAMLPAAAACGSPGSGDLAKVPARVTVTTTATVTATATVTVSPSLHPNTVDAPHSAAPDQNDEKPSAPPADGGSYPSAKHIVAALEANSSGPLCGSRIKYSPLTLNNQAFAPDTVATCGTFSNGAASGWMIYVVPLHLGERFFRSTVRVVIRHSPQLPVVAGGNWLFQAGRDAVPEIADFVKMSIGGERIN